MMKLRGNNSPEYTPDVKKPIFVILIGFGFFSFFGHFSMRKLEEAESENKNSLKLIAI